MVVFRDSLLYQLGVCIVWVVMVKVINHFLRESEKELVLSFIDRSIMRFKTRDSHTKTTPPPLDVKDLSNLYMKKLLEWNKAMSKWVPNTAASYLAVIRKNNVICPIEVFLESLKSVMDQETPPCDHKDVLDVLEDGLSTCGASCPCPAEC